LQFTHFLSICFSHSPYSYDFGEHKLFNANIKTHCIILHYAQSETLFDNTHVRQYGWLF
jgi:hypothetical protein